MSLELVNIRTRTRGRAAKEFSYMGVGRLKDRKVEDKNGLPVRKESKDLEFKDVVNEKGETERVLVDTGDFLVVDEVSTVGLTDKISEVYDLFGNSGLLSEGTTPVQAVIIGALSYYNELARDAASPTPDEKEDILGPLVAELVKAGILVSSTDKKKDDVATWRRTVTMGSNAVETSPLEYAEMTKEVKRLRKMAK